MKPSSNTFCLVSCLFGLSLFACGTTPEQPEHAHRSDVLSDARSTHDAFDVTASVLTDRFTELDPYETSRADGVLQTGWRESEEPGRLVRSRAKCVIGWTDEGALLSILVQRETSTAQTSYGELDRQSPRWNGGEFLIDRKLQTEIARAVTKDMAGS